MWAESSWISDLIHNRRVEPCGDHTKSLGAGSNESQKCEKKEERVAKKKKKAEKKEDEAKPGMNMENLGAEARGPAA